MIRVSVIYNKTGSSTFDQDYYVKTHMPMASQNLHPAKMEVDEIQEIPGLPPPTIHCVGYLYFNSMADFEKGVAGIGPVMADIPNYYSGGEPTILVSQVVEV